MTTSLGAFFRDVCANALGVYNKGMDIKLIYLENTVYHMFRQTWLVLAVKLMEIDSNGCFPGSVFTCNLLGD